MEKKHIIYFFLGVVVLLLSVTILNYNSHPYKLTICNGEGFTYMETWVYCDEFHMISPTEADITVDGKVMRIKATRSIRPESN